MGQRIGGNSGGGRERTGEVGVLKGCLTALGVCQYIQSRCSRWDIETLTSFSLLDAGQRLLTMTTIEFSPDTVAVVSAALGFDTCADFGVSIAFERKNGSEMYVRDPVASRYRKCPSSLMRHRRDFAKRQRCTREYCRSRRKRWQRCNLGSRCRR